MSETDLENRPLEGILSELQTDVISELMNIGMGHAAASLSEMVGEEVLLKVPSVEFIHHYNIINHIENMAGPEIAGVRQSFEGVFWGHALLLFPENDSLELVRALLQDDIPLEELSDMEQDALAEVGNIIINACLGSLSNVLGEGIDTSVPVYLKGDVDEVIFSNNDGIDRGMMLVRLDFNLPSKNINGYVAFTLDISSLEQLKNNIDNFLSGD